MGGAGWRLCTQYPPLCTSHRSNQGNNDLCEPAQRVKVIGLAGEDEHAARVRADAVDPPVVEAEVVPASGAHLHDQAAGGREVIQGEEGVVGSEARQVLLPMLARYLPPLGAKSV